MRLDDSDGLYINRLTQCPNTLSRVVLLPTLLACPQGIKEWPRERELRDAICRALGWTGEPTVPIANPDAVTKVEVATVDPAFLPGVLPDGRTQKQPSSAPEPKTYDAEVVVHRPALPAVTTSGSALSVRHGGPFVWPEGEPAPWEH